jgi:MFS family permease
MANSAYAIIAPFLPFEFQRKGIDETWMGYIFSIYSVAVILCSPMVGKMIGYLGRRNLIVFGMTMMGFSFIFFGAISSIEHKPVFITLALIIRFLQGFSSSLIQTTMYSLGTNFFPEDKNAMVGYIEAATGIGLIMGPLIGSGLYWLGGYIFIFYSLGLTFVVCSTCIKPIFPSYVDNLRNEAPYSAHSQVSSTREENDDYTPVQESGLAAEKHVKITVETTDDDEVTTNINIGTFELLKYPEYLFAAGSGTLGYFIYGFMEPVLAVRVKSFNVSQVNIGLFFTVMPVFYIPTSVLVQQVPNGVHKRVLLIMACLMAFFANLFVGPSELFNFPDNLWFMVIGQALRGIIDPFTLVPCLPEMIESVLPHYPPECECEINNLSSGLFNMFLGLGSIMGPMAGAELTRAYGYRATCDIVAVICLIYAILYYVCGNGKAAFRVSRWKNFEAFDEQIELINVDKFTVYSYNSDAGFKNNTSIGQSHDQFNEQEKSKSAVKWSARGE